MVGLARGSVDLEGLFVVGGTRDAGVVGGLSRGRGGKEALVAPADGQVQTPSRSEPRHVSGARDWSSLVDESKGDRHRIIQASVRVVIVTGCGSTPMWTDPEMHAPVGSQWRIPFCEPQGKKKKKKHESKKKLVKKEEEDKKKKSRNKRPKRER